jgi:hypothetical protein
MPKGFRRQRLALKIAAKNGLKKRKDHAVIEATHQATQADTRPKFVAEAALLQMANTTRVAKLAAFGSTVTVVWSGTDFLKMQRISHKLVYYLPGWGGRLHTGLGEGLAERGFDIAGRETRDEFKDLTFQQKIDTIASDLQAHFWSADAHIVVNSFGGYLFLHAQAKMQPFPGKVLLLSPIVGDFRDETTQVGFVPPRPEFLMEQALAGCFPKLTQAEIHVGSEDWQSNPVNVQAFGDAVGIPVTVVPGGGHMLGKEYVAGVLDGWLLRLRP